MWKSENCALCFKDVFFTGRYYTYQFSMDITLEGMEKHICLILLTMLSYLV